MTTFHLIAVNTNGDRTRGELQAKVSFFFGEHEEGLYLAEDMAELLRKKLEEVTKADVADADCHVVVVPL